MPITPETASKLVGTTQKSKNSSGLPSFEAPSLEAPSFMPPAVLLAALPPLARMPLPRDGSPTCDLLAWSAAPAGSAADPASFVIPDLPFGE